MEQYAQTIITPKLGTFTTAAIIAFTLFMLCVSLLPVWAVFGAKNTKIIVDGGVLSVRALLYNRRVPLGEVDVGGVRKLDLRSQSDRDYKPTVRTNGIGLPGCLIGWVKLHNGHKALVYLTDRTNVALIPTAKFDILFSAADVDGIKNALSK